MGDMELECSDGRETSSSQPIWRSSSPQNGTTCWKGIHVQVRSDRDPWRLGMAQEGLSVLEVQLDRQESLPLVWGHVILCQSGRSILEVRGELLGFQPFHSPRVSGRKSTTHWYLILISSCCALCFGVLEFWKLPTESSNDKYFI